MSVKKYKSVADNSITNAYYSYTNKNAYLANAGAADSLEIFSIYHSGSESEKSRVLLNFPINSIKKDRDMGNIPASGSVNFFLKLYNVEHTETVPSKFFVSIVPISSSWQEGYGLDLDNHLNQGQSGSTGNGSNWIFRTKDEYPYSWNTQGGDFLYNYEKTYYFDTGLEDLEVDVTKIIEDQILNIIPSNGICVKISGSYEDGTKNENFYTKRFSARSSEFFYKTPSIDAKWGALIKDNRSNFYFENINLSPDDNTQNIYFYNKVNGSLKNLYGNPDVYVKILNSSGTQVNNSLTASNVSPGIYKLSTKISGSVEESLKDVWYSGSHEFFNGIVEGKIRDFYDNNSQNEYEITLTNLKSIYKTNEKALIKIFAREKNWSPNIYLISTNEINNLSFNNLYYKISRVVDEFTVIDYGIEPIPYTQCSYDKLGNYFELDMSIFEPGYMYKINFMLVDSANQKEFKNSFKFKVE